MTDKVTEALNFQHASETRDASGEWQALDVLAAEVRRLQAELSRKELERWNWEQSAGGRQAKLERVEALLRAPGKTYQKDEDEPPFVYVHEVDAALRD